MAEQIVPLPIVSLPGIKRDGTQFEGNNYVDGKWVRWQRGLPRKIGGYRTLTNLLGGISRGMAVFDQNNRTYTHSGTSSVLEQFTIAPNGVTSSITDRTPAGFTANANYLWQFDNLYEATATTTRLIAHAAPNALDISSDVTGKIYYGTVTSNAVLTDTGLDEVSGGVVSIHPYLVSFGSNGIVAWTDPNDPTSPKSTARPTASKIVRGLPLRAGGGQGPAGLLWSLDSLLRMTFTGGSTDFTFDTITGQSSIMAAQSVIEYDGIFYWIGVDRFLMFNGVVREVPNEMNSNFFFDNLNFAYRNKIFATKVPRFGEIWWFWPKGPDATECNWVLIYNVRENTWYDTPAPNGGRSAAQFAQVFRSPIMAGIDEHPSTAKFRLWQHEFGVDELDGTDVLAIDSYFETAEFSFAAPDSEAMGNSRNKTVICNRLEPDFVQSGVMTCQAFGRANARAPDTPGPVKQFPANASIPAEQLINDLANRRLLRFRFGSNVQGGDYQMGKPLMHVQDGDGMITS